MSDSSVKSEVLKSDKTGSFINLKIVSKKNGIVFRGKCQSVLFNTQLGQMQILAGHVPVLANIDQNTKILVENENGTLLSFLALSMGFLVLNTNECLITLPECEAIDKAKISANTEVNFDSKKKAS